MTDLAHTGLPRGHNGRSRNRQDLELELATLRARCQEAETALDAIRSGQVDALFIPEDGGGQVLMLGGNDSAFRSLVEAMNEGAAMLSPDGLLLYCNGRLATMLNRSLEQVMGSLLNGFVVAADTAVVDQLLGQAAEGTCAGEISLNCAGSVTRPVQLSLSHMNLHGQTALCAVVTDLTDRKRAEAQLSSLALVDELTGLSNRRGFMTLAGQQLKLARRLGSELMLLFADLDGMKHINDHYGHHEGDQALQSVAAVLKRTFRDSDIIARLGGDEFAVLASGVTSLTPSILLARLQSQLDCLNDVQGRTYTLALSIGLARYDPHTALTFEELMGQADQAMYDQKRHKQASRIGTGILIR